MRAGTVGPSPLFRHSSVPATESLQSPGGGRQEHALRRGF